MKKIVSLLLLSLTLILQSCVVSEVTFCLINNEEIIQIDSGNKGAYSLKLDLHDFISMMSKGMPEENDKFYSSIKIDTTILFNDYLKNYPIKLTEQENSMFENGSVEIKCNAADGREIIVVNLFYKSIAHLDFVREHIFEFVSRNVEFVFSLLKPKEESYDIPSSVVVKLRLETPSINFNISFLNKEKRSTEIPDVRGFDPVGKNFNLKIEQNSIQNSLISLPVLEKAIKLNKSLQDIKSAGSALDTIFFRTTFIVSKEIKEYKGSFEKVSPDKKTITFKSTLSEILSNPQRAEFLIRF